MMVKHEHILATPLECRFQMPRIVILSDFASYIRINSQNLVVVDLRSIFRHRNFFKWPEIL